MKLSIPIMIDSVKNYESFKMTRCTYFSVVSSLPFPKKRFRGSLFSLPVLLIGWEGVIFKPLGVKRRFSSPKLIDKLFDLIESREEQYVDTNDIWIPNSMFNGPTKRGSVYRISKEMFTLASSHRYEQITKDVYLEKISPLINSIKYSESETLTFKNWQKGIIDQVKEDYSKKAPEEKLKWQD